MGSIKSSVSTALSALSVLAALSCTRAPQYDAIIRHGTVYDGSGGAPVQADVAIKGDSIVGIGDYSAVHGAIEVDATGLAVAPGFINMLSWANTDLLQDGRSMGDLVQGVTLEVMGEGESMGPWNDSMKAEAVKAEEDFKYDIRWTTLGEYLDYLASRGISTNVASFVGTATVRQFILGHASRAPTPAELTQMQDLVRAAMKEGAVGVGSSLIYEPGMWASTEELAALASAAHESGGMYISHIRNEDDSLFEAVNELIDISRRSGAPAEIYHIKASGKRNWGKLDSMVKLIENARQSGLRITADMYTYPASSTGLDAVMPGWVREGGFDAWRARLLDPIQRRRLLADLRQPGRGFSGAGGPQGVLLVGFKTDSLRYLQGKSLAEVAEMRHKPADETALDLIVQDGTRVQCVYFTMSEDNVRREVTLPWISFASDGGSMAPEGLFLTQSTHPRAYGNFARLLGKYVRDEKALPLEEAIRRLSAQPAGNLSLARRGSLKAGYYADVVVFDPATITDHATFDKPHQLATGMRNVFVNGVEVIKDGVHTGAKPGRFVHGPGYQPK